jgi:signal peptidase I
MSWKSALVGHSWKWTLVRASLVAALLVLLSRTFLTPVRAQGTSMEPTYHEGQLIVLNRLAYRFEDPARGDVVAIPLAGGNALLVKRIVALPGERFHIEGGVVFVGGRPLPEPYVKFRSPWRVEETELGPDEYFVVGDNRGMRARAHDFGIVTRDRIAGRMVS